MSVQSENSDDAAENKDKQFAQTDITCQIQQRRKGNKNADLKRAKTPNLNSRRSKNRV